MISEEIRKKIETTDYTMMNGRYQNRAGRLFSRVTTIIGMVKFDDGFLEKWRKKMAIKDFCNRIDMHGIYKGDKVFEEFSKALGAADEYTFSSASFGTKVHKWIEDYMLTGTFPILPTDEYANVGMCVESVKKFLTDAKISPTAVEVIKPELFVYSEKYGYAGSADFVCAKNDNVYLFDWKTSNRYYINYALQLAAYAKGIEELYGLHIKKASCVVFGKEKVEYDVHTYTDTELDYYFELFKACLVMHNFVKHYPIPNVSIEVNQ